MSDTAVPNDHLHLSGAWNFRDVAESTAVRPGILFRSSQLAGLDDDGRAALTELGVTDVFDFRGVAERERAGADAVPAGVRVHETPFDVDQSSSDAAPHEAPLLDSPERARQYMEQAYAEFPTLPGAGVAIAELIHTISDGAGAVLVHCAAGKDRAGWASATVLRAVGVSDSEIVADYLRSNDAVPTLRQRLVDRLGDAAVLQDNLLGVDEEYYRIGMRAMETEYGDFDGYLTALGIDTDTVARLRARLLG